MSVNGPVSYGLVQSVISRLQQYDACNSMANFGPWTSLGIVLVDSSSSTEPPRTYVFPVFGPSVHVDVVDDD